ncbi:MAG: FAD-dependent monooxygenase, partial [Porticoccus sp.]
MADHEYDVVVAGAGMVGAAFAALLATTEHGKNLRIAVLEARPFEMPDLSESFDPRVVALTAPSRKLLQDTGAWDQITARRVCPYQRMEVWEADGTGHIEFDCAEVRQPSLGHIVENALVVEALWQRLEALENVELLCPATVVGLERQAPSSRGSGSSANVAISLADGSIINTKLLAAADGAQSKVRELCG